MAYQPQFTISPTLLSLVEAVAALRERILSSPVSLSWIPALVLLRTEMEKRLR
jgi:hypothetical protein